jgi:hypothetical protein
LRWGLDSYGSALGGTRLTSSFLGRAVEQRNFHPILNDMKYRGIEHTVVQGIGRQLWKWSVSFDTEISVTAKPRLNLRP